MCVCVCVCVCFGSFILKQEMDLEKHYMDLEKHYSLLLGVRNFGMRQDHKTMWGWVWNDKICYNNVTKFGGFSSKFFCFVFSMSFKTKKKKILVCVCGFFFLFVHFLVIFISIMSCVLIFLKLVFIFQFLLVWNSNNKHNICLDMQYLHP